MRLEPNDMANQIAKELSKPRKAPKGHMFPAWAILKQLYPELPWYKLVWKWLFYKTNRELPLPDIDANEPPKVLSIHYFPTDDVIIAQRYKENGKPINEHNQPSPTG